MRDIKGIIIHCTATRPNWWAGAKTSEKVSEIRRWHVVDRGWSDIGYHYLIDRDGTIAKGRDISRAGAHVAGHNTGTIGISLFGGHGSSERDQFADNFTPEQNKALRELLADLQGQFGQVPVTGHNEYAAKACPGFTVHEWLESSLRPVARQEAPMAPPAQEVPKPSALVAILAAIAALFTRGRS